MLQLVGKCLGIKTEWIKPGTPDQFEKITARIQSGSGFDTQTIDVGFARDYPRDQFPKDGEDVVLNVVVSAYAGRNGAGYRLTALNREHKGQRAAA